MSVILVTLAILLLALAGYACGRLHEQFIHEQHPERPADWAQRMAHEDPQRLINLFRQGRVPEADSTEAT